MEHHGAVRMEQDDDERLLVKMDLREDEIYSLILRNLMADGYAEAAASVSRACGLPLSVVDEDKETMPSLRELLTLGMRAKRENDEKATVRRIVDLHVPEPGMRTMAEPLPTFRLKTVSSHKAGGCRAGAFSRAGDLAATGASDGSIKVFDSGRAKGASGGTATLRTFTDHADKVNALVFHPFLPTLISGSKDATIRFYDVTAHMSRASAVLQDSHSVRALAFHPSGDYLLAATEHPMLRIFDVSTAKSIASQTCYLSADRTEFHTAGITAVAYGAEANVYVTASRDGSIKLWDGVTNKHVNSVPGAHGGAEIVSVALSQNTRYMLSAGRDSTVKLWELSTGRVLRTFADHLSTGQCPAVFTHNDRHVLAADERTQAVFVYDVVSGECVARLQDLKTPSRARWLAASPSEQGFVGSHDDGRARFWFAEV